MVRVLPDRRHDVGLPAGGRGSSVGGPADRLVPAAELPFVRVEIEAWLGTAVRQSPPRHGKASAVRPKVGHGHGREGPLGGAAEPRVTKEPLTNQITRKPLKRQQEPLVRVTCITSHLPAQWCLSSPERQGLGWPRPWHLFSPFAPPTLALVLMSPAKGNHRGEDGRGAGGAAGFGFC